MTQNPRPPDDDPVDLETKPFLAHLEDLRWTIIRCVAALLVAVVACAFGVKLILRLLYHPYRLAGGDPAKLINIDVTARSPCTWKSVSSAASSWRCRSCSISSAISCCRP